MGRRGVVGGWERQVFGSELSLALRTGDCIESRTGVNDFRSAQRNVIDGLQAERRPWCGYEETWTCGTVF